MKIYIASSWKNQHGVEMLTQLLRDQGHTVSSWIENSYEEELHKGSEDFKNWLNSLNAAKAFIYDTQGAAQCDLLIFYTYAGNDSHAELAIAWTKSIPIYGLRSKGYERGLMSRMINRWFDRYTDLLDCITDLQKQKDTFTREGVITEW